MSYNLAPATFREIPFQLTEETLSRFREPWPQEFYQQRGGNYNFNNLEYIRQFHERNGNLRARSLFFYFYFLFCFFGGGF